MKCEVEVKITLLEGAEAGKLITEKKIADTVQDITEFGIIERLRWEWNYIHDVVAPLTGRSMTGSLLDMK